MKLFVCMSFLLFSLDGMAQDLSEMIQSLDVDKASVSKIIDALEKSGKITKNDAAKARADLAKMKDSDFKGLKDKAKSQIKSNTGAAKEGSSFANENAAVGIKILDEE